MTLLQALGVQEHNVTDLMSDHKHQFRIRQTAAPLPVKVVVTAVRGGGGNLLCAGVSLIQNIRGQLEREIAQERFDFEQLVSLLCESRSEFVDGFLGISHSYK